MTVPAHYSVMVKNYTILSRDKVEDGVIGLKNANIVYEAEIEGGYTRFMAIYKPETSVPEIGTIRSTRLHFVHWMKEYNNNILVHCGGSPEALHYIRGGGAKSINLNDQLSKIRRNPDNKNKQTVWDKDNIMYLHHKPNGQEVKGVDNAVKLYTTTDGLKNLKIHNGPKDHSKAMVYKFNGTNKICNSIQIGFNVKYGLKWVYDPKVKMYHRITLIYNKTEKVMDIFAKTIIIQYCTSKMGSKCDHNIRKAPDGRTYKEIYHKNTEHCIHIEYKLVGEGKIFIIKEGQMEEGMWKKKDLDSPTLWFNKNKKEVTFEHDKLWIQVVNQKNKVALG